MDQYTLTTAAVTAATASGLYACFKANTNNCEILRISITNPVATLLTLQIGRPSAVSASPLTTTTGGPTNPSNTRSPLARLEYTWTVAPTTPPSTGMIETCTCAASIGTGYIFAWPSEAPLIVLAGAGLSFINNGAATGPAFNMTILYRE